MNPFSKYLMKCLKKRNPQMYAGLPDGSPRLLNEERMSEGIAGDIPYGIL